MKIAVALLVIFCLIYRQGVSAKIQIRNKSVVHLDKLLVFDRRSYTDGRLTYALCDKNPRANPVKCTVYQEKKPYSDETYSCDVFLKRISNLDKRNGPHIEIIPFGKHYAVLGTFETGNTHTNPFLNLTIVQFDNCKVSEAALEVKGNHSFYDYGHIVGDNESFDVFFKNRETSCAGKTCKATIDSNGKIVNGPVPSVEDITEHIQTIRSIVSLRDKSSKVGYFYIKLDKEEYVDTLVKSDGTETFLTKHPQPNLIAMSTKNQLISVCYQKINEDASCIQYDFEGNTKLQTMVSRPKDMYIIDLYNLPNGGFYVAYQELKQSGGLRYFVERIDSNGKKTGSFEVQGHSTYPIGDYHQLPLFYENENKETCVSVIVYDSGDASGPKEGKGHLYLTSNCFTDADFSHN